MPRMPRQRSSSGDLHLAPSSPPHGDIHEVSDRETGGGARSAYLSVAWLGSVQGAALLETRCRLGLGMEVISDGTALELQAAVMLAAVAAAVGQEMARANRNGEADANETFTALF